MIDAMIPIAAIIRGSATPLPLSPAEIASAEEETIAPRYDSNKSAPIPATSPTLSPTLSAITAGFLGSSSGIPISTFPTKSAPTSAALVNIPPPTLAKEPWQKHPFQM